MKVAERRWSRDSTAVFSAHVDTQKTECLRTEVTLASEHLAIDPV